MELNTRRILPPIDETAQSPDDLDLAERGMRRALGLDGTNGRETLTIGDGSGSPASARITAQRRSPRHKGSTEGNAGHAAEASLLSRRIMELESQFASERELHDGSRHLLQQAQIAARELETRMQDAVLSQRDDLTSARQETAAAQRELDEATFDMRERDHANRVAGPRRRVEASPVVERPATKLDTRVVEPEARVPAVVTAGPDTVKKRGRPRVHPVPEPKPVRWWTPSYQAKAKG